MQEVWDSQALEAVAVSLGFKPEHVVIPLASNDPNSSYTQGKGAQKRPLLVLLAALSS